MSATKTCSKCHCNLPVSEFYKNKANKDGLYSACKKCHCARTADWSKRNPEKMNGYAADYREKNHEKRRDSAKRHYRKKWGSDEEFRERCREKSRHQMLSDPAKYREMQARQRSKHADRNKKLFSDWYLKNKDYWKNKVKSYANVNRVRLRPYNCARQRARQASRICATPPWADHDKIAAIYAESAALTMSTGIRHHVDHYYPLRGKLVCGLHVETNLVITTAKLNQEKGNKMPVD